MVDHAASIQGLALRVCKLGPTGAPLVGAKNAWVTNAFMSLSFTPEYTEGDEIEEKGADGSICVYYKMPDVLKRVTFELAICNPEPQLEELLVGGTVLESSAAPFTVTNKELTGNVATLTIGAHTLTVGTSVTVAAVDATFNGTFTLTAVTGTTVSYAKVNANVASAAATGTVTGTSEAVGFAAPPTGVEATPNGVSIETWSRAIVAGKPAAVNPYFRWIFPYTQMRLTGDRTLENGMMANTFEGWGVGNAAWGNGPQNDWLFPSDRAYQQSRVAAFPTGINGYQAVLADA